MSNNNEDYDYIDKIIAEMDFEYLPSEFVKCARVYLKDGSCDIMSMTELSDMFSSEDDPYDSDIVEIKLEFDFESFKETIVEIQKEILNFAAR